MNLPVEVFIDLRTREGGGRHILRASFFRVLMNVISIPLNLWPFHGALAKETCKMWICCPVMVEIPNFVEQLFPLAGNLTRLSEMSYIR